MNVQYRIHVLVQARRDLLKLPEKIAAACIEFIAGPLTDNPYRVGKPLQFEYAGKRSARRGGYRIIYQIHEDRRTVEIHHIDHRANVYR